MRPWAERVHRGIWVALTLLLIGWAAAASARSSLRTVVFHGYSVTVPASWPVYDLTRRPSTCVRFDRHAVYLGVPGAAQRCPSHAAGRSEAILLEPLGAAAARGASIANEPGLQASATAFVAGAAGIRVLATWGPERELITRALHRRSLPALAPSAPARQPHMAAHAAVAQGHAASVVYTGLGFDACSAPSSRAMTAWSASPYRALNIYIGGANSACSQPNLSSTWVGNEIAAGWRLVPTYVGLQAPSNSCGCQGITPGQASSQGQAAAQDAVAQAQSLGLPPGTPIYDDMEAYSRTSTNTTAVLTFLSAWTTQLHAQGYVSGVYSSTGSGIADLVAKYGTGYAEPDDLWIADWNNQRTTSDPAVPSPYWPNHQRIHQYSGAHNETYGGVTINIDGDYLDGATAATGGAGNAQVPPPSLAVSPVSDGTTNLTARWSGLGLQTWQVLGGLTPSSLSPIGTAPAKGATTKIAIRSAASYFAVQAIGSSGQSLALSPTAASPRHLTLYGRSVFVNTGSGVGGLPAGCYVRTGCHVVTTVTVGRSMIARTTSESLGAEGTGILFFRLTVLGRRLLARAPRARLAAQIVARDSSGTTATGTLTLIPFSTNGQAPPRSLTPSSIMRPVGVTDFVFARGQGGILTACNSVAPCLISATLSVGRTTIATTGAELVGGVELGYVQFVLTGRGRAMLAHAAGNHLGASLVLRCGSAVSRARIALVQFS